MSASYYVDTSGKYYCLICSSKSITPWEMSPERGFVRDKDNTCKPTYVCPNCKNVVMPNIDCTST